MIHRSRPIPLPPTRRSRTWRSYRRRSAPRLSGTWGPYQLREGSSSPWTSSSSCRGGLAAGHYLEVQLLGPPQLGVGGRDRGRHDDDLVLLYQRRVVTDVYARAHGLEH